MTLNPTFSKACRFDVCHAWNTTSHQHMPQITLYMSHRVTCSAARKASSVALWSPSLALSERTSATSMRGGAHVTTPRTSRKSILIEQKPRYPALGKHH